MKRNQISRDKSQKLIKKVVFIFLLAICFSESFLFSLSKATDQEITRKKVLFEKIYERSNGHYMKVGRIHTYNKFYKTEKYECALEGLPGVEHKWQLMPPFEFQYGPIRFGIYDFADEWRKYKDFLRYLKAGKVTYFEIYDGATEAIVEVNLPKKGSINYSETRSIFEKAEPSAQYSDSYSFFKVRLPGLTQELMAILKTQNINYKIKEGKIGSLYLIFNSIDFRFDNNEIIKSNSIKKDSGLFRSHKYRNSLTKFESGVYLPQGQWSNFKKLYVVEEDKSSLYIYDLGVLAKGYKIYEKCLRDIKNKK